jgi:hypothetical protein
MPQPASNTRFGAFKARHGTTPIATLRSHYGPQFAKGCSDSETLSEVLHKLDEPTLPKQWVLTTVESWREFAEAAKSQGRRCATRRTIKSQAPLARGTCFGFFDVGIGTTAEEYC